MWCLGFPTPYGTHFLGTRVRFYNVVKFLVFCGFFEEQFTFWNVLWNWIKSWMFQVVYVLIQESYDMALESLDVLFFADRILGTTGVPYAFLIFHLWVRVKCFIEKFDWMNVIFGYHAYQYGTQNYLSGKVWYLSFPTPCPIQFSNIWMRLCVVMKSEYFSSKSSHFWMPFHIYQNH